MNKFYFKNFNLFFSICLFNNLKAENTHNDLLNKINESFPAEILFYSN